MNLRDSLDFAEARRTTEPFIGQENYFLSNQWFVVAWRDFGGMAANQRKAKHCALFDLEAHSNASQIHPGLHALDCLAGGLVRDANAPG